MIGAGRGLRAAASAAAAGAVASIAAARTIASVAAARAVASVAAARVAAAGGVTVVTARAARAVVVAAVLLAAGCAHIEREPLHDGLSFDERRQRLTAVPAWEMRGRLAVNTGERAFQGSFSWLQDDAHSTLIVRGPLGGGILEVTGSPERMVVTARGEQRLLEDPETELSALLGWWMPVESLSAWLLGLPDPQHGADARVGANAALEAMDQRLWHVEYGAYQLTDGVLVPRRIDMAHDTLELRLTVDAWQPAASAARASP